MFLQFHQYLKNNCGKNQTTAGLIHILRRYKLDLATKKKKKRRKRSLHDARSRLAATSWTAGSQNTAGPYILSKSAYFTNTTIFLIWSHSIYRGKAFWVIPSMWVVLFGCVKAALTVHQTWTGPGSEQPWQRTHPPQEPESLSTISAQ